jgi:putative ABC transport system permease protein
MFREPWVYGLRVAGGATIHHADAEFFATAALFLSALGLYGVINYSVSRRTQETGVRMALGAQRGTVMRLVVGQGLRLAGFGVALGFVAVTVCKRLVQSQFFEVRALDPVTFLSMAAALVVAAVLASYFPARRAPRSILRKRCATSRNFSWA